MFGAGEQRSTRVAAVDSYRRGHTVGVGGLAFQARSVRIDAPLCDSTINTVVRIRCIREIVFDSPASRQLYSRQFAIDVVIKPVAPLPVRQPERGNNGCVVLRGGAAVQIGKQLLESPRRSRVAGLRCSQRAGERSF